MTAGSPIQVTEAVLDTLFGTITDLNLPVRLAHISTALPDGPEGGIVDATGLLTNEARPEEHLWPAGQSSGPLARQYLQSLGDR